MASVAVKEAMALRIQAAELRQGPWGPIPLYSGAFAVLHGTAADQVSATKLAIVQEARTQGKIKTEKIDKNCHPPGILTRPLQGKKFVFKWGRLLGLQVTPATKSSSDAPLATEASGA